MGQYAKAEPLYQRALKIREKAFGPNNPKTAYSLNDLGALYVAQDDYAKAEKLFQRALKIREKSLGADHPDTAVTMQNLAATYRGHGPVQKGRTALSPCLSLNRENVRPRSSQYSVDREQNRHRLSP